MNLGDIGVADIHDPEKLASLKKALEDIPALKEKDKNVDTLEKLARAYMKKYKIRQSIIYVSEASYTTSLEADEGNGLKRLTLIYAETIKEMYVKIVIYSHHYTRRKYREN